MQDARSSQRADLEKIYTCTSMRKVLTDMAVRLNTTKSPEARTCLQSQCKSNSFRNIQAAKKRQSLHLLANI